MCVGWDECVLVLKQAAIPETRDLLTWGLGEEEDGCVTDSEAMVELVSLECKRESNCWYWLLVSIIDSVESSSWSPSESAQDWVIIAAMPLVFL